jgi:hypothetical protein
MDALERVWTHREEAVYPRLFGDRHRGIFVLTAELFADIFRQDAIDPRWLTHGVHEYGPTASRASWIYVTSGTSNPWELSPEEYAASERSGIGIELVFEVAAQGDWAIVALQRLLAFALLLAHGRFGDRPPLTVGHRVPLGGPIDLGESAIRDVLMARPTHYDVSFELESGRVDLLHVVGLTDAELAFAESDGNDALLARLVERGAFPITDPRRHSVV